MNQSAPSEQQFIDEYTTAQQPWGATELTWHAETPKERSGSNPYSPLLAVPNVEISPDFFHGKEMKELIEQIQVLIEKGENFLLIKPDNLASNSGWKTFLIALAKKAKESGYTILQTENTSSSVYSHDGNHFLLGTDCVLEGGVDPERDPENSLMTNRANNQTIERWVQTKNSEGVKNHKIIVIATETEYDDDLTKNGVQSKIRRLSPNGKGGLPRLTYPEANWVDIIDQKIATTEISLDNLLLADKVNKKHRNEGFGICQEGQEEAVRQSLQLMANLLNGRITGVLQGDFGIGKSVNLSRMRSLLGLLRKNQVITQSSIGKFATQGATDFISRSDEKNADILIIDDEFGVDANGSLRLWKKAWERKGILAASNAPVKDIQSSIALSMTQPIGLRGDPKAAPFSHLQVIHMGGKDFMDM